MTNFSVELEVAKSLVREGGFIVKEFFGKQYNVEWKEDNSFVTSVDLSVERFLRERIALLFPNDGFVGEEIYSDYRERTWIVDPIDGTTNFLSSVPFFNISVALKVKDEVKVGIVYNPITDEMFYAEKGKGAFMNGRRLSVRKGRGVFGICFGKNRFFDESYKLLISIERDGKKIRKWGSAALEISYVAYGVFDGFFGMHMKEMDYLAASLIAEEAGAFIQQFVKDNKKVLVVSSNKENLDYMKDKLYEVGILNY